MGIDLPSALRSLADRIERRDWLKHAILIFGLLLSPCLLYAPSLFGDRILLPLESLRGGVYLPEGTQPPPSLDDAGDLAISDAALLFEPQRKLALDALHAGHLPLWDPYNYGGAPFLASNQTALFSPLQLLSDLVSSPRILAWCEVLKALISGIGAFLFFRRALRVRFWAALFGAWCFPLCGYFVLWGTHPPASVAIWLPWLLLFSEGALQNPLGLSTVGLAVSTALALVAGHAGVAAQMLIGSGLYAVGRCLARPALRRLKSIVGLLVGWVLGATLSGAQSLPTVDYLAASVRIAMRLNGGVETPPSGLRSLLQIVLPYYHSSQGERLSQYFLPQANRIESPAAGYVGLLVALCLAPLGLSRSKRSGFLWSALLLGIVGVAQIIPLPILGPLLMKAPLSMLRNHRLVVLTGMALLSLAVLGVDSLLAGERPPPWIRWSALGVTVLVGAASVRRGLHMPLEQLAQLETMHFLAARKQFVELALAGAAFALLGAVFLFFGARQRWLLPFCTAALIELLWMAAGVTPQRDPALYFPKVPALEAIKKLPWGRVVCMGCMPANIGSFLGLYDVRGYDGADPIRRIQYLELFRATQLATWDYAKAQWFAPKLPSPLADLLSLRYVIFRGTPPPGTQPVAVSPDYYVMENPTALPRAFVPDSWEVEPDLARRLARLADASFDPGKLALLEEPVPLPRGPARGSAKILADNGDSLRVAVEMRSPGLLVVTDSYDPGWRAFLGEVELPVLPVDQALRAVALPQGTGVLEFRYQPQSFTAGVELSIASALILALWSAGLIWFRRAGKRRVTPD